MAQIATLLQLLLDLFQFAIGLGAVQFIQNTLEVIQLLLAQGDLAVSSFSAVFSLA